MKNIYSHNYSGSGADPSLLRLADKAPPWRKFERMDVATAMSPTEITARPMSPLQEKRGRAYLSEEHEARMVSAALILRRPLLVTGIAGVGKSSLAYSVAWQLGLGDVLRWNVTSRSTLKDALYEYDAVSRLHDVSLKEKAQGNPDQIGEYITLGPLGTALLPAGSSGYFPRVLLIDELDKADADLPSDLLHVLEEGAFEIREIARHVGKSTDGEPVKVRTADGEEIAIPYHGTIQADDFPFIIMTSNGERDFPPAFKRRCLPLEIHRPTGEKLRSIVRRHLGDAAHEDKRVADLIKDFDGDDNVLRATDQLLNAIQVVTELDLNDSEWDDLKQNILRPMNESPSLESP